MCDETIEEAKGERKEITRRKDKTIKIGKGGGGAGMVKMDVQNPPYNPPIIVV